jgi:hypothetical protein
MTDETPMEWEPLEEQLREKITEWRKEAEDLDWPYDEEVRQRADEIEELIE